MCWDEVWFGVAALRDIAGCRTWEAGEYLRKHLAATALTTLPGGGRAR